MRLLLDRYDCTLAGLLIVTDDEGNLRALDFDDHEARMKRLLRQHYGDYALVEGAAPRGIVAGLGAYFAGEIEALDDVEVETGGTAFQQEVWRALRAIPAGTTTSYGELAGRINRRGASRAVGAANGSNPVAIVVPCHRVIGADGTLTGYGGGLAGKRWLLAHERQHCGMGSAGKEGFATRQQRTSQSRLIAESAIA